jgi:SRR1
MAPSQHVKSEGRREDDSATPSTQSHASTEKGRRDLAESNSRFVCVRARGVVRYSVHGGAWLRQMTEGYGALPGWGDGTGKPTRASLHALAPAPVKKATVAPVTDEWTVVAGRGSRPRPVLLLANKHAPPASASNPAAATTSSLAASAKLSRALEDVGKDSLVSAVVSALRLPVRRALLLGLGPPVSSVTARHQLALALLLVATLKLDAALAVYDPVLGAEDVELLLRHGCRVVTEAEARLVRSRSLVSHTRRLTEQRSCTWRTYRNRPC